MDTKIVIIGAGVVGLAIAAELSKYHQNIYLFERHPHFGLDQSSRNSEVIHAGMYYPDNSLKARLCVEGNRLLYEWCNKFKVNHQNCEKLIVATSNEDLPNLYEIYEQGKRNGLQTLELINQNQINHLEPNVYGIEAIHSKSTGIVNSHQFMASLESYAFNHNVTFSYNSKVIGISQISGGYEVRVLCGNEEFKILSEIVINSAGLYSDQIAEMVGINTKLNNYEINFVRGHYFKLSGKYQNYTKRLIYPVPKKNWTGIGIHITKDLLGYLKLGPDVQFMDEKIEDYSFHEKKLDLFFDAAKKYIPNLKKEDLNPDQVGIRAKLQKQGEPFRDFVIKNEHDLGLNGFINLIGIESPGLTSSLAIAKYVKKIIDNL